MKTPQQEIDALQARMAELRRQQQACSHTWMPAVYNPEKYQKEELTGEYECHGVDRWPKTRFVEAYKQRWTRVCSKCGQAQHTYTQETKTVVVGPKFT